MPMLKFEQHTTIQQFIQSARSNSLGLANMLIAHSATFNPCKAVLTL
jgi:hypothetical protein